MSQIINPFALASWGATTDEVNQPMVGDAHIAEPHFSATRAVSVDAAPGHVFPWLRQMGYGRAGWYSYDWIDNLGRPSAREINPAWQRLGQGDPVPAGPIAFVATVVNPDQSFCLVLERSRVSFTLAFELIDLGGQTRLISRARSRLNLPLGRLAARWVLEPCDGVMVRRQLLGIKDRAEAPALTAEQPESRTSRPGGRTPGPA